MIKINLLDPQRFASQQKTCEHQWKIKTGFLENYQHCIKCGLDTPINQAKVYPGESKRK